MRTFTTADFQQWGAVGGRKSRRVLTVEQARAMVVAREKKKLLRLAAQAAQEQEQERGHP